MNEFRNACILVATLSLAACTTLIEETGDVAVAAAKLPFRVAHAAVDAATGKDESHSHEQSR
jgi:hypothetical protein